MLDGFKKVNIPRQPSCEALRVRRPKSVKTIDSTVRLHPAGTPQSVQHILPANINSFTYFSPLSEAEVSKLILSSHPTTCPLDPIPSYLLQAISPAVVPAFTHIINIYLHTGIFPSAFKLARITPLLKKPTGFVRS